MNIEIYPQTNFWDIVNCFHKNGTLFICSIAKNKLKFFAIFIMLEIMNIIKLKQLIF